MSVAQLRIGDSAPAFTLEDQTGTERSLKEFLGRTLVLYVYPKDNTDGCTAEACGFRDAYAELRTLGATVIGVSPDSVKSHAAFASTYALPLTLLSDPSKETIRAYGAWGKKTMYGKEYEGVLRTTVVIDPEGIVRKIYASVSPEHHAAEVLADLRGTLS